MKSHLDIDHRPDPQVGVIAHRSSSTEIQIAEINLSPEKMTKKLKATMRWPTQLLALCFTTLLLLAFFDSESIFAQAEERDMILLGGQGPGISNRKMATATAPTTIPSTQITPERRLAEMKTAFEMMRDKRYAVRDRGYHALLRIDHQDLPVLLDMSKIINR